MFRNMQRKFLLSRKLSIVLPSIVDPDMFNRTREVERPSQLLISPPKLSVVTGPVNSGKSKLIDYVVSTLSQKTKRPFPVYSVNLQQGTYTSVQSLVDSLSSDVTNWLQKIQQSVDEVSVANMRVHLTKGSP